MRAIIAGGGVGGLSLALALNRHGIDVVVFEQAEIIRETHLGVHLKPEAMKRLAALGISASLHGAGNRIDELIYKTAFGREILRQPCGLSAGHAHPQIAIDRGKLQKALYQEAVVRIGCDKIHFGQRLVDFAHTRFGVAATFARFDGGLAETISGDVLIGADAAHAAVWRRLHEGAVEPGWTGALTWRGATRAAPAFPESAVMIAGDARAKLALFALNDARDGSNRALINWVVSARILETESGLCSVDDWSESRAVASLASHIEGAFDLKDVDISALIRSTRSVSAHAVRSSAADGVSCCGRVAVLGDVSDAFDPTGSDGVSQTILDAARLSDRLASMDDPVAALAAYDADRVAADQFTAPQHHAGAVGEEPRIADFDAFGSLPIPDELRALIAAEASRAAISVAA